METTFDLVIRNGTLVSGADGSAPVETDVGISDQHIAGIAPRLGVGRLEIDATGKLVLPGAIDAHCHVAQKSSTGLMTADDFLTATRSAACGGTTTIIPFAAQHRGDSLREVVREYHARAERSIIDYGFHLIVADTDRRTLEEDLPALINEGCTSFKVFMTYDALKLTDAQILDVLAVAREQSALVMVHAENSDAIAWVTRQLLDAGRTAPKFHAEARPAAVEREAIHRVITLSEIVGTALMIVHVSGAEALDQIRWARSRGLPVFAETCPQYLMLTGADLDRTGFEGAKYVFSPPPRDRASQEALWNGLQQRTIDIFSSDHAPYRFNDVDGKAAHGTAAPFTKIPSGVPGLETCFPLLFSEGVVKGRLTLQQFVELSATNAARIYGLSPRKGVIAPGADADVAIWDPDADVTITNDRLHHRMDYTPYEGMRVTGWPVVTISRGEIVWADGEVKGRPGRGRFVARRRFVVDRPQTELAAATVASGAGVSLKGRVE
jgi:dihydropyrimidinase